MSTVEEQVVLALDEDGHTPRAFVIVLFIALFGAVGYYLMSSSVMGSILFYVAIWLSFFKTQSAGFIKYMLLIASALVVFAIAGAAMIAEYMFVGLALYACIAIALSPRK